MRFETKVPMKKDMKIAVLIDAENISHKYAHTILQEASSLGNVIYKRIYGNWMSTQLGPWKKELLDHAIQPIQQFSNTTGKNSSDSALIIDAMDCSIKTILMLSASFLPIAISRDLPRDCVNPISSFLVWANRSHRAPSFRPAINSYTLMSSKRATSARRASRILAHASARTPCQNVPSKTKQALPNHPNVANQCALSVSTPQALQERTARMRLLYP